MLSDYIAPGDKLDITSTRKSLADADEQGSERKIYHSRVYDISSDEVIEVEMPMEKGKMLLLSAGEEYDLCFYGASGLYQSYARVRERYKAGALYILVMELTSALRKFQRRQYYRFNCILNMSCRQMSQDEEMGLANNSVEFLDNDLTLQDGVIVDISGGGARFVSKEPYDEESHILFKFSLDIEGKAQPVDYSLLGRVVQSHQIPDDPEKRYENRIQFVNINSRDRETIIKYIFEEERKIRQRDMDK